MKDFLGNEILVGDDVVYLVHHSTSSQLCRGTVKKLTEKTAVIDRTRKDGDKIIDLTAIRSNEMFGKHCGVGRKKWQKAVNAVEKLREAIINLKETPSNEKMPNGEWYRGS